MNSRLVVIIASVLTALTIAIVLVVAFVLLSRQTETPTPSSQATTTFPTSGTVGGKTATGYVSIANAEGESIMVSDFMHNGVTKEDPANPGTYYVAGSSAYCDVHTSDCTQPVSSGSFNILYSASDHSFIIGLTKEPLKQAREDAEHYLENTLQIGRNEMCSLNYYLTTDSYTSSYYGGVDLKFSFCPNAVALP